MKNRTLQYFFVVTALLSCNHFTATPHSKKQQLMERPSPFLCDRIVDFRIAEGGWPTSKLDFSNKGIKYYEAIKDFPYQTTDFKIKDSTEMIFYFSNNIKDINNKSLKK